MREISPSELAEIIENKTGSLININELRKIILEEGAVLVHNGNKIANINITEDDNYILVPIN